MVRKLNIGAVARLTGLSTRTIRFYEKQSLVPPSARSNSGYRLYAAADVQRLQLIRRARQLGLALPEVRTLIGQAYADDCSLFADQLSDTLRRRRAEVETRQRELAALMDDIESIERHVQHCCEDCSPAAMAAECAFCGLLVEKEGGDEP